MAWHGEKHVRFDDGHLTVDGRGWPIPSPDHTSCLPCIRPSLLDKSTMAEASSMIVALGRPLEFVLAYSTSARARRFQGANPVLIRGSTNEQRSNSFYFEVDELLSADSIVLLRKVTDRRPC